MAVHGGSTGVDAVMPYQKTAVRYATLAGKLYRVEYWSSGQRLLVQQVVRFQEPTRVTVMLNRHSTRRAASTSARLSRSCRGRAAVQATWTRSRRKRTR